MVLLQFQEPIDNFKWGLNVPTQLSLEVSEQNKDIFRQGNTNIEVVCHYQILTEIIAKGYISERKKKGIRSKRECWTKKLENIWVNLSK